MPDPTVRPGETYADEYPGNAGRLLRVERVEERKLHRWSLARGHYQEVDPVAVCTVVAPAKTARVDTTGRTQRIAVRRMRPGLRGYRLVAYACAPLDCTGGPFEGPGVVHCEHGRPFGWGEDGWEPIYTVEELGERLGVAGSKPPFDAKVAGLGEVSPESDR